MEAIGIAESIQEPQAVEDQEAQKQKERAENEKQIEDAEAKKTAIELESAAASISHHINYMRSMSWEQIAQEMRSYSQEKKKEQEKLAEFKTIPLDMKVSQSLMSEENDENLRTQGNGSTALRNVEEPKIEINLHSKDSNFKSTK